MGAPDASRTLSRLREDTVPRGDGIASPKPETWKRVVRNPCQRAAVGDTPGGLEIVPLTPDT
jgi:hypothetical protein